MDFEYSDSQKLLKEEVAKLVSSFKPSYWRDCDKTKRFPFEFWNSLAAAGYFGISVPKEYGGVGLGMLDLSILIQSVAHSGGGVMGGNLFTVASAMVPFAIRDFGSRVLKETYLPRLAKGEIVCSIGITEPSAGVNTLDVDTFAEKRGGEYIVSGQKVWMTFAPVAGVVLLVARTTRKEQVKKKTEGLSLFLLDMKSPKIRINPTDGLVMRPLLSSEVFLEGVSIPEENLIGEENKGWQQLATVLNTERVSSASLCIGTGELVLEKAVRYAMERIVFGRPIGQNQGIQFPLADSKVKIETARQMVLKAAWLYDMKRACSFEANCAAYMCAQASFEAADRAIQTFGGMGFAVDNDLERHWRDLRLWKTAPIPEQMVLSYVANHVLGLPRTY